MGRTAARKFTVAEIAQRFELASYWFGERWCPAVHKHRDGNGYGIRFIKSVTFSGANQSYTFDYFELDNDGVITTAPRGYAKEYKPGVVVDIAEALEQFATPDPNARRIA